MKKEGFISIRLKMTLGVIIICFLIGSLAVFSVNRIATGIIDREYSDRAEQIAEAMVQTLDPEDVAEIRKAVLDIYDGVGYDNVVLSSDWGSDAWNAYMANYESVKELPVYKKLRELFATYQDIYKVDCIYITAYKLDIKHSIYIIWTCFFSNKNYVFIIFFN